MYDYKMLDINKECCNVDSEMSLFSLIFFKVIFDFSPLGFKIMSSHELKSLPLDFDIGLGMTSSSNFE